MSINMTIFFKINSISSDCGGFCFCIGFWFIIYYLVFVASSGSVKVEWLINVAFFILTDSQHSYDVSFI